MHSEIHGATETSPDPADSELNEEEHREILLREAMQEQQPNGGEA